MKATVFYRPDDVEALLLATVNSTVRDSRVADVAISNPPISPYRSDAVARREDEGDVEYALRAWSHLLPTPGAPGLLFRQQYGWAATEALKIAALVSACRTELLRMSEHGGWGISSETLRRDAERLEQLLSHWRQVCNGQEDR